MIYFIARERQRARCCFVKIYTYMYIGEEMNFIFFHEIYVYLCIHGYKK